MNLTIYVESLRDQLLAVADLGNATSRETIERLSTSLEPATRLVLLEAISAAADEITREIAPGAVEVRLRGSDPDFVVAMPSDDGGDSAPVGSTTPVGGVPGGEDEGTARLNLRLPETLKGRIEEAAQREGLSLNAWLVRTAAAAVEGPYPQPPRSPSGSQRYTGWVS